MKEFYNLALQRIQEALENNSTSLDLSYLRLNHIPKEIKSLKNLIYLDLSHNFIQELPEELTILQRIGFLDLGYNLLNFHNLKNQNWIFEINNLILDENPIIQEVPFEISRMDLSAIFNYYESAEISTTTKLYETKLLLVGNGEVGKTTLRKKLLNPQLKIKVGMEPTTHGISLNQWKLSCTFPLREPYVSFDYFTDEDDYDYGEISYIDKKRNNIISINSAENAFKRNVKLNIWDFGGQEIYHATHQFFLTKRSIYLFLWEARKEEEYHTFEYWLSIIKFLSLGSPVILVMNKSDIRIKNINEDSLKKNFPNISSFLQVSCKTGEGIYNLIKEIRRVLKNLPHLTNNLPNVWLVIRSELTNLGKNYISADSYYDLCSKWGLSIFGATYLSDYFHDLGVILHFKNDSILHNIVILNPEWVTTALYKLVDDKYIQKNKGKFSFEYLKQIWNHYDYPTEKHYELMRLMEKFELCFKIVGTDDYIIPELLPSYRPESEILKFNTEDNLKFEYRYKFMPAGILSRLTCRLHHLIYKDSFWKDGAILKFEKTLALLINEKINKKLKIVIIGEEKTNLLAIIRNDIDVIHSSINLKKNEDINEMIPCICKVCVNSLEPHYYEFVVLKRYEQKGKSKIDCYKSIEEVLIKDLLHGFEYKNAKNPILQLLIMACSKLQQNHKNFSFSKEDDRNSFIASIIDINYIAKDQTRAGVSESGKSIGELDLLIKNNEKIPKSVFEAFNLDSLDKTVINKHLNKIFGYDTNGLKENFILVYCDSSNFYNLHTSYFKHIQDFKFEYTSINTEDVSYEYSYGSELKVFLSRHTRNNEITNIFHILVNLNYNQTKKS